MSARDPILWAALAFFTGAATSVAPAASLLALALTLIALRRLGEMSRVRVAVIAALFCVGAVRGHLARREAKATYDRALELLPAPSRCVGHARVIGSPLVRGGSPSVDVELVDGACDERAIDRPFRTRLANVPVDLGRGDELEVAADLSPVHRFANEATGDGLGPIAHTGVAASGGVQDVFVLRRGAGIAHWVDRAREIARRRIDATYHPEAAALGRALLLGETDLVASDDEAFRVTGLSHLLAVSGTHLVIAIAAITAALRALLLRVRPIAERWHVDRIVAVAAIPLAWIYSDFAGGNGSVVRAAGMLTATLVARTLGRRSSGTRAFAFSLVLGAALDPLAMFDVSFALSAAATLGLLALSRPIASGLGATHAPDAGFLRRAWSHLATALGATLGATLFCAPVLASISPSLPIVGIACNLLAAPLGELFALPLCFAHVVLSFVPTLERGAGRATSGALLLVLAIARAGASTGLWVRVPPPTAFEVAVVASATSSFALATRLRTRIGIIAAGLAVLVGLELRARSEGHPLHRLRVSALDVGQGDSILIDLPDGKAMLIDGGGFVGSPVDPGKRVVLPALRGRRRSRVDVVAISHPHPDHFTGIEAVVDDLEIGELWDTGEAEHRHGPPPMVRIVDKARAKGAKVRRPDDLCRAPMHFGEATIEVLAPCAGVAEERGSNDNSFVLKISMGSRAALLTGDAERTEESELLALDPTRLRADLLKVGHHGSATSTTLPFLEAVSPSTALISCGVRNRFGHPRVETLDHLSGFGITIARTDRGGEWRWETDGTTTKLSRSVHDPE